MATSLLARYSTHASRLDILHQGYDTIKGEPINHPLFLHARLAGAIFLKDKPIVDFCNLFSHRHPVLLLYDIVLFLAFGPSSVVFR